MVWESSGEPMTTVPSVPSLITVYHWVCCGLMRVRGGTSKEISRIFGGLPLEERIPVNNDVGLLRRAVDDAAGDNTGVALGCLRRHRIFCLI